MFNKKPKPGKPREVTDETFLEEVLGSDKPAVVDFWSARCSPCQVMTGLLNEVGPEYAEKINFFKLNIDQNPVATSKLNIASVPTLLFFKGATVVDMVVGLLPLNPLKEKLDKHAAKK